MTVAWGGVEQWSDRNPKEYIKSPANSAKLKNAKKKLQNTKMPKKYHKISKIQKKKNTKYQKYQKK